MVSVINLNDGKWVKARELAVHLRGHDTGLGVWCEDQTLKHDLKTPKDIKMMPGEREAIFSVKAAGKISANYNVDLAAMLGVIEVAPTPTTAVAPDAATFAKPQPMKELGGALGLTTHQIAVSLGIKRKHLLQKFRLQMDSIKAVGFQWAEFSAVDFIGNSHTDYVLGVDAAKFIVARYGNEIGAQYLAYLIRLENKVAEHVTSPALTAEAVRALLREDREELLKSLLTTTPAPAPVPEIPKELLRLDAKEKLNIAIRARYKVAEKRNRTYQRLAIRFGKSTTVFTIDEYRQAADLVRNGRV
jgi:hypothetical protein